MILRERDRLAPRALARPKSGGTTSRHYDVVVLGRSLGCLVAAALLARRELRVLLLGQGERAPSYGFEGRRLARRRVTVPYADNTLWRRVLRELALTQTFRRLTTPLGPSYSVLLPERRLSVFGDAEATSRDVSREFPEVQQLVEEVWAKSAAASAALEAPLTGSAVCPPETFFERLRARRAVAAVPSVGEEVSAWLAKFPSDHPYRAVALAPTWFASHQDGPLAALPALAFARLGLPHGREPLAFQGGQDELERFWLDYLKSQGGACELGERASALLVRGRRLTGLMLAGADEPIGADNVLTDAGAAALLALSGEQGPDAPSERVPLAAGGARYVLSCVVKRELLPEPLGQEAYVLSEPGAGPPLHLSVLPCGAPDERVIVVELIVPAPELARVRELRPVVLGLLRRELPFLDRHLVMVDSPHDGLPLELYGGRERRLVERVHLEGASAQPEPMQRRWVVPDVGFLGLAAEPVRGPIRGTYLVGSSVLPALGDEGELIAAWSAAELVTESDAHRQRRRRQMWSKLDPE